MENNKNVDALEEKDLADVTGGIYETLMQCDVCGRQEWTNGNFLNQTFSCPTCGEHLYFGSRLKELVTNKG